MFVFIGANINIIIIGACLEFPSMNQLRNFNFGRTLEARSRPAFRNENKSVFVGGREWIKK